MKKMNSKIKFGSIKEMLKKEMLQATGGNGYITAPPPASGGINLVSPTLIQLGQDAYNQHPATSFNYSSGALGSLANSTTPQSPSSATYGSQSGRR
jgi:hypothetical protein